MFSFSCIFLNIMSVPGGSRNELFVCWWIYSQNPIFLPLWQKCFTKTKNLRHARPLLSQQSWFWSSSPLLPMIAPKIFQPRHQRYTHIYQGNHQRTLGTYTSFLRSSSVCIWQRLARNLAPMSANRLAISDERRFNTRWIFPCNSWSEIWASSEAWACAASPRPGAAAITSTSGGGASPIPGSTTFQSI